MPIICDDGSDEAYCDQYNCGGRLFELKDGSMMCSLCEHQYRPNTVHKHKRKLHPSESPYDSEEPLFMHLTDYATPQRKSPSILDREDNRFVQQGSGRSITSYEEFYPEAQPRKVGKA
jgi:uncharacterized Zn finger protein (UPF0148 family)